MAINVDDYSMFEHCSRCDKKPCECKENNRNCAGCGIYLLKGAGYCPICAADYHEPINLSYYYVWINNEIDIVDVIDIIDAIEEIKGEIKTSIYDIKLETELPRCILVYGCQYDMFHIRKLKFVSKIQMKKDIPKSEKAIED